MRFRVRCLQEALEFHHGVTQSAVPPTDQPGQPEQQVALMRYCGSKDYRSGRIKGSMPGDVQLCMYCRLYVKSKADNKTRGHAYTRNDQSPERTLVRCARLSAQGWRIPNRACGRSRKGKHARHSHHGNQQRQGGKSTEPMALERSGVRTSARTSPANWPLHRLVCRHVMDRSRDDRNNAYDHSRAHKKTAVPAFLGDG